MGLLGLEIACVNLQGHSDKNILKILAICQASYYLFTGLVALLWLNFLDDFLGKERKGSLEFFFRIFFLCVLCLFSFVSIKTGWLFYIDDKYHPQHGPLYFLMESLIVAYMGVGIYKIIKAISKEKYYQQKMRLATLLPFNCIPVLLGIVNAKYSTLPIVWPAFAICLFIIFVNYQDYEISIDGLTGLNNRNSFDRKMQDFANDSDAKETFFMLMMDLDGFKKINDTFGHSEGDRALKLTAKLLKKAMGGSNFFLARYGGDEFAILGKSSEKDEPQQIKTNIKKIFEEENKTMELAYPLSISIGCARFGDEGAGTIQGLINSADKMLYIEKGSRRRK